MRHLRALVVALLVLCAAGVGLAEVNLGGDSTAHLHVAPETLTNNWLVELNREGGEQLGRDVAARNGFLYVRKVRAASYTRIASLRFVAPLWRSFSSAEYCLPQLEPY